MMTEDGGLPNESPDAPANPTPGDPAIIPPSRPAPGILPALPERRAWPWSLLLAISHQALTGVGFALLNSHQEVLNLFFFLMVGLVPLAFIVGLMLIARKRSFPGRVLMFGALYSCALVALELAVAAGVCIFAFSKPGAFH
ncbi:MAG TPA: hypothetical protein VN851_20625 [Thermoanaerobaculia bacterium]|nr:hypothetical protein [Thermoanaerobaculia bacterium]